jgi:hypothetical protein
MPVELSISPAVLLAMWAGGLALATSAVAGWKVARPGFLWIAAATSFLAGAFTSVLGPPAVVALILLVVAALVARRRPAGSAVLFGLSGVGFLVAAELDANPLLVVTGAVVLGGTTGEMLLGHWYLVDPQLPRWALRRLDAAGIAGLATDALLVAALGGLAQGGFMVVAYGLLAAMSILMMVGVWFSLGEKGYEGVMAATGLSYLSVLTSLGAVALGRFLVG